MSDNLQQPDDDEKVIQIDGTDIDSAAIKQQLGLE